MRIGYLMLIEYKLDSIIMVLSMILREVAGFLGIVAIVQFSGQIDGWNLYEISLLFAMCAIVEAISQTFLDSIWGLASYIRRGAMDIFLVRPANPFFQILGQRFHFTGLISMLVYLVIYGGAIYKLHINLDLGFFLFNLEFLVCATMINSGIYTICNSINFWLIQGNEIANIIQGCREFAKYPLTIFPRWIKGVFTYIIPFGMVGYYPAAYLTGKIDIAINIYILVAALFVDGIAVLIWKLGIKSYNSTGS